MSVEEDCVVNDGGGVLIFPVMGPGAARAVVTAGDTQLTYDHTHLLQNENNHKSSYAFGKRYCSSVSYQKLRIMAPKGM